MQDISFPCVASASVKNDQKESVAGGSCGGGVAWSWWWWICSSAAEVTYKGPSKKPKKEGPSPACQ